MNYVNTALAGLVNGLNPCSLSMLLFLISLLLAKENINILKPGLFFIAGKFISYLIIGTVLFSVMSSNNMSTYEIIVKLFMGTFIIIVAGLNIFDFFALKKEKYGDVKNQLPSGLRKWNHKVIEKFNNKTGIMSMSIGALILGLIVSAGEFLCTGQVYVATIVYMLKNEQALSLKAFSYLITYSLAFIIPILIIIFILHKTRNIMNISEKIRKNMPVIKLLTAFILIILGILVVFFL
jgi:cytochrome c biogenesis protein CcdA